MKGAISAPRKQKRVIYKRRSTHPDVPTQLLREGPERELFYHFFDEYRRVPYRAITARHRAVYRALGLNYNPVSYQRIVKSSEPSLDPFGICTPNYGPSVVPPQFRKVRSLI